MTKIATNLVIAIMLVFCICACQCEKNSVEKTVPTYKKDISRIITSNCAGCHHQGGPGPFSLTSYEDVKDRAVEIVSVTQSGVMPPWKLSAGWGEFVGQPTFTAEQKEMLKAWQASGCPLGEGSDPPVPVYPEEKGWRLGKPDLILKMSQPYMVPASGPDIYRCFVLPMNLKKDTFVKATEFHSSNDKVTHHCLLILDNTGAAAKLDLKDPGPGYQMYGDPGFVPSGGLGNWVVGHYDGDSLPEGISRLAKGSSDLVLQMHFHPTGKEEKVQAEVAIYFEPKPPRHVMTRAFLVKFDLDIPPGVDKYESWQDFTLPIDTYLLGLRPHAHNICKEAQIVAQLPDSKTIKLLKLIDWDFNWQMDYKYKKPIYLPKGTRIKVKTVYDNSQANIHNPNHPSKRVYWGQSTKDEMFFYSFDFIAVRESERQILVNYVNTNTRKFLFHAVW